MLRYFGIVRATPAFLLPLFGKTNEHDHNFISKTEADSSQRGWDRVKKMFKKNEYDEYTPEFNLVLQSTCTGAFFGAAMGGFVHSRDAYLYFIENNQATAFKSTVQAKKKLQDYVTVAFAKGGYKWGWRLAIFTGLFSVISSTIAVYRDRTSVLEYSVAGFITGGVYRANLGLAASCVSAALGCALSTVAGSAILLLLKVSGVRMDDIKEAMYSIKQARVDQMDQALEKYSEIKNDDLTRHHDTMVKQKGEKKVTEL